MKYVSVNFLILHSVRFRMNGIGSTLEMHVCTLSCTNAIPEADKMLWLTLRYSSVVPRELQNMARSTNR
jgi:hypothetical protein